MNRICLLFLTLSLMSATPAKAAGVDPLASDLAPAMGKALFERIWVPAPASTDAADGLGPLFNARSCSACHHNGGRGSFQESADGTISGDGLLLRLGNDAHQPDRVYGRQIQTRAVQGIPPEGQLQRLPTGGVTAVDLAYGPLASRTKAAGRLAPTLLGIGLLARVPQQTLNGFSDPDDEDGDGISGRINRLNNGMNGRFGWKAGHADLTSQIAAALFLDMGLSTPQRSQGYGDCTVRQTNCRNAPNGNSDRFDGYEVNRTMIDLINAYLMTLPAPSPQNPAQSDPPASFMNIGCAACHRPTLPVADDHRLITPFTDLLLHDLGDRLADGIANHSASGNEWRTAPLWGLKFADRFLHDGRAHTIEEAIAWHGGEADNARIEFFALPEIDRQELLNFLGGL